MSETSKSFKHFVVMAVAALIVASVILVAVVGIAIMVVAASDQLQVETQQRLRNETCAHVLQCVDAGGERDACATHFPGCEDRDLGRELPEPEES